VSVPSANGLFKVFEYLMRRSNAPLSLSFISSYSLTVIVFAGWAAKFIKWVSISLSLLILNGPLYSLLTPSFLGVINGE
jgi:hypothetical protein